MKGPGKVTELIKEKGYFRMKCILIGYATQKDEH